MPPKEKTNRDVLMEIWKHICEMEPTLKRLGIAIDGGDGHEGLMKTTIKLRESGALLDKSVKSLELVIDEHLNDAKEGVRVKREWLKWAALALIAIAMPIVTVILTKVYL